MGRSGAWSWSDFDSFVGLSAHFLLDMAEAQFPDLECRPLGGAVAEVISVNPVALLCGVSSFPTCLPTGPRTPRSCPLPGPDAVWFGVWSQISPGLHQLGDLRPSQLQNSVLLGILKNMAPNQLCTAEHLIKLYWIPDLFSEYKLRPMQIDGFCEYRCSFLSQNIVLY